MSSQKFSFKVLVRNLYRPTQVLLIYAFFMLPSSAIGQERNLNLWVEAGWLNNIWPIVEPILKERYPEINVIATAGTDSDIGTLRTALVGGQGPDLFSVDSAPGRMGLLAEAGLLLPLESYYEEFGWNDIVLPWAKERVIYTGPSDSNPQAYGLPQQTEFIAVFYKKETFNALGLTEPETYDDFINILSNLKENDYLPIIGGFREPTPRGHFISTLFQASAGTEEVESVLFGDGKWTDEGFLMGAVEAQRLAEEGYLIPEVQSLDYDAALQLWLNNPKTSMIIIGTWILPDLLEASEDYGFFAMPPIDANLEAGFAGGLGSGFAISASAKDPEAAAMVLDILVDENINRKIAEQAGYINPFTFSFAEWNLDPLTREVVNRLFDPSTNMGYNLSVVTPSGFVDEYYAAVQGLTIGELTPEDFTARLQAAWEKFGP